MRIGVIAALPGELKPLVRRAQKMPVARGSGIAMWEWEVAGNQVVAICAGMGAPAARRAFTAGEFAGSMDAVISVGWAGALAISARPRECYAVSQVVDSLTGERFFLSGAGERLVTTAHVADSAEKERLAASYGASLVDMEAAAVARLAQMRGIPMACFKAVSDGVGANLPDLNPFIDVDGKMKMLPFLAHISMRPQFWFPLAQLGSNSAAGAQALAKVTEAFLQDVRF